MAATRASERERSFRRRSATWLFLALQVPGCLEPLKCKLCKGYFGEANYRKSSRRCKACDRANQKAVQRRNPVAARASRRRARHRREARIRNAGGAYREAEWQSILTQHDHRCVRCGKQGEMTVDHRIPLSLGGSNDWTNLQPMCHLCNSRKGPTLTGCVQAVLPGMLTITA